MSKDQPYELRQGAYREGLSASPTAAPS